METVDAETDHRKLNLIDLPPEIHEHIIRFCGVGDVLALTQVNHFLNDVVQSKLRDLLIAACQNGTSIDQALNQR